MMADAIGQQAVAFHWDAVVVTSESQRHSIAYLEALKERQAKGLIPHDTILLSVSDPGGKRLGSGAATLNALLVVAEHLSARAGFSFVDSETVLTARILLLHVGGRTQRIPPCNVCTKALSPLPSLDSNSELIAPLDLQLDSLSRLCKDLPPGLMVASTESIFLFPQDSTFTLKPASEGAITLLSFKSSVAQGEEHGVCLVDEHTGEIANILYRQPREVLESHNAIQRNTTDEHVLLYSGTVYLSADVTETLLNLNATPPLDLCTYLGVDNGGTPIQFELYKDILLSLATGISKEEYLSMDTLDPHPDSVRKVRELIWNVMRAGKKRIKLLNLTLPSSESNTFNYLRSMEDYLAFLFDSTESLQDQYGIVPNAHSIVSDSSSVKNAILVNSRLLGATQVGTKSLIEHSILKPQTSIGNSCFVSGLRTVAPFTLGDNLYVQEIEVHRNSLSTEIEIEDETEEKTSENDKHDEKEKRGEGEELLVTVICGIKDNIHHTQADHSDAATFMNKPFKKFVTEELGWEWSSLWPSSKGEEGYQNLSVSGPSAPRVSATTHSLFNAKLFPAYPRSAVEGSSGIIAWYQDPQKYKSELKKLRDSKETIWFSMEDILQSADPQKEFLWRKNLCFSVDLETVADTLRKQKKNCLLGILSRFARNSNEAQRKEILQHFDGIASDPLNGEKDVGGESAYIVMRTLATIADLLAAFAGTKAGLRSGPARNQQWRKGFELLEAGKYKLAIKELARQRNKWLGSSELLMRASRHYEGAAQIMISKSVWTAQENVKIVDSKMSEKDRENLPMGTWVVVETPSRVDVAGGWSDTPPITFEHGGCVVNLALKIDGKRPISARARRIPELLVKLSTDDGEPVICTHLSDLADYCQPLAKGALLKTVLLYTKALSLTSNQSLAEQLTEKLGGGVEISCRTDLPQGSGLGTSSILAGALVSVVSTVLGNPLSRDDLTHSVLVVEQMLTTGGGWQDQVGGIYPGIKYTRSSATLPLTVHVSVLDVDKDFVQTLNDHLLLIYTGRTRLARGLLQDVLRRWHARLPEIVRLTDELIENAERMKEAIHRKDLPAFGSCVTTYWGQKKRMAQGAEPQLVTRMIERLKDSVYGYTLAGAGGGGFLLLVTKDGYSQGSAEKVKSILSDLKESHTLSYHAVEIDTEGHYTFTSNS